VEIFTLQDYFARRQRRMRTLCTARRKALAAAIACTSKTAAGRRSEYRAWQA
jgi:hypothetical protein